MKHKAKKIGAISILVTMFSGLANEARIQIKDNKDSIIKLEVESTNNKKKLDEIHGDIKQIHGILMNRRKK